MVPHRGASGRAISVYSTPWPPTCSGVLPSWCTIEVAALLVFTEEAAILDAPGRLSHTCTCQRKGKHWDHSQGAGVSQQWSKGSYSMHSPALFAKRIVLVKRSDGGQLPRYGQQYPDVKGLQPAPIRRPAMRLDMAVFAWEHMMHEQAAYHWNAYIAMCLREDRRDSHWRQPWTPVSVTLVTEMADQKSLHWACNRHISMVGLFLLLVWQNQHHLLSLSAGFIPCHSGITWVSSMIFSEPSGSIPCVASSAITWVNLPTVGG